MVYRLLMHVEPEATTESIATVLEQAAGQVREMSSVRAAHSMVVAEPHGRGIRSVNHGTSAS